MLASVLLILVGIVVIVWSIRLQVGTLLGPMSGFFHFWVGFGIIAPSLETPAGAPVSLKSP